MVICVGRGTNRSVGVPGIAGGGRVLGDGYDWLVQMLRPISASLAPACTNSAVPIGWFEFKQLCVQIQTVTIGWFEFRPSLLVGLNSDRPYWLV